MLLSRGLRVDCHVGDARRCFSSTAPVSRKPDPGAPKPPYNVLFFGADFFSCAVLKELWEAGSGARSPRARRRGAPRVDLSQLSQT